MDWNIRDDNGDTPIMIALRNKEVEMVKILLKTPGVDLGDITNTKAGIYLIKEMERADLLSKVPECPVCLIQFRGETRVFQCTEGHFICGDCDPRVVNCPVCREDMMGRAHDFERFLQDLNLESQ